MKLRWHMSLAFVTAILICVSGSTAFSLADRITWSYSQRKVSSGKFPIHSACMMPAQGHLSRIGFKGAEGMSKESGAWTIALENLVESHLKSDGIAIDSANNPLSSGASSDEIRGLIDRIQRKHDTLLPLMNKKPARIAGAAYTLGDEVGSLPCSANSDILVFIQGQGQVVTVGRSTMTLAVGGPAEGAVVLVTLADAKTGEIVGFIQMYPNDRFLEDAEVEIGERLDKQLAIMNIGSARKNARAHGH